VTINQGADEIGFRNAAFEFGCRGEGKRHGEEAKASETIWVGADEGGELLVRCAYCIRFV